jgi:hypothetical protein
MASAYFQRVSGIFQRASACFQRGSRDSQPISSCFQRNLSVCRHRPSRIKGVFLPTMRITPFAAISILNVGEFPALDLCCYRL